MGKTILSIYVAVQTFAVVISMVASVSEGEVVHVLSRSDWWMFIVSCGILAICEALEGAK